MADIKTDAEKTFLKENIFNQKLQENIFGSKYDVVICMGIKQIITHTNHAITFLQFTFYH